MKQYIIVMNWLQDGYPSCNRMQARIAPTIKDAAGIIADICCENTLEALLAAGLPPESCGEDMAAFLEGGCDHNTEPLLFLRESLENRTLLYDDMNFLSGHGKEEASAAITFHVLVQHLSPVVTDPFPVCMPVEDIREAIAVFWQNHNKGEQI